MIDIFINPQIQRVHAIDKRLDTAKKYAQHPTLSHIGRDLAASVRRDILREKPHRVYTELPLRSHYEPVATAAAWRERIALIRFLSTLHGRVTTDASSK